MVNSSLVKINYLNKYTYFFIPKINIFNNYFLKNLILYYYIYKFNKIRQYGKTYRMLFYKYFVNFRVGRSHLTWIFFKKNNFFLLKKKKNLFFIKIKNKLMYNELYKKINLVRKPNTYTKRGIRINKYKFKKRYGKISQAFMGLH